MFGWRTTRLADRLAACRSSSITSTCSATRSPVPVCATAPQARLWPASARLPPIASASVYPKASASPSPSRCRGDRAPYDSLNQARRQLESVRRTEAPRTRAEHVPASDCRTALAQAFGPTRGNRLDAVHGAEERPADRCVGVGIPSSHDGVDHSPLQVSRMKELPEGVVKRDQHPTLLPDVLGRGGGGAAMERRMTSRRETSALISSAQSAIR